MNKKNHFIKIFFTIFTLIVFLFVLSVINYISCLKSSQKLSFYSNNNHEIMRIKIYGSSTSKEGNTISGTFSIINMNGNEIAVIERSWNGSYLVVEFCKIRIKEQCFVYPFKIFGKKNIMDTKKDSKKGTKLRKYYTENRECLLLGNDSTKSQRKALYNISLLGIKYLSFLNFYFTDFCTIDLSECKTNRYYSITYDKNGKLFVSEI